MNSIKGKKVLCTDRLLNFNDLTKEGIELMRLISLTFGSIFHKCNSLILTNGLKVHFSISTFLILSTEHGISFFSSNNMSSNH